ncbi:dihydroxyacetone kinase subunit DhaK [Enterococcus avium]|uniref:phosphoenolpyruvate--glycerone phosphotransferase n=1 Tax=Enterococcus avium TaxID=33945 RepID=A0ABD5F7B0_ENTAV|nr:dihydroxyacetone kinase subunit DhaK [Enterococcus avium]MDT2397093.1 dihydroxyacetone kinase subunit DhaK [Enterococcus avium]MDT2434981.1 dihydroxyacetone kinase subunit DhaK [Enterococcus avium]MDT2449546.1 dihydroxyacetone kinase subunit DhaK [Enterococcus avium]MDT2465322.1 dihydroxyacetone kinase subunit DhaK [Enterococcus avium]MDT2469546.1 dihydroxyacetone kinase subunit DhaK [Enterococcus avium]
MKRLINDGYEVVEEMLEGYAAANKQYVDLDLENRVVVSKLMSEEPRVRVIVGGGSGHEPMFLGYVGKGFADAAVVGNVNTSPAPDACYEAVKAVDSGKGCLYLYGNYAGDVMNFDMGAEMALEEDGIRVETVTTTDDVYSAKDKKDRRGVAGDLPVFKVAGSAAAKGYDLDKVKAVTEKANDNTYSLGVALSSSTLPVTGEVIFQMDEGDMEIGMGIHGEPGIERRKVEKADVIIDEIMNIILEDSKIAAGDEVYVLVNGLGALPVMDQYVCYRRVDQILTEKGIQIHRTDVGNFATSMDMVGMSVTLVKLDDEIKELLDAPCDTPYYKL